MTLLRAGLNHVGIRYLHRARRRLTRGDPL